MDEKGRADASLVFVFLFSGVWLLLFPLQRLIVAISSSTDTGRMRKYYSSISTPPRRSVSDTLCMIALRCSKNIALLVWLSALASAALVRQIHLEPKANGRARRAVCWCVGRSGERQVCAPFTQIRESPTAFKSQHNLFFHLQYVYTKI